jgi:hypothetical protein
MTFFCAELLVNFACSSRAKGFDLGHILVFPSDKETKELAEGLGLTTYYDEKVSLSLVVYGACSASTDYSRRCLLQSIY